MYVEIAGFMEISAEGFNMRFYCGLLKNDYYTLHA